MYYVCLHDPRFPKKRTTLYIPAKAKYECANSALRHKRKKKEVYFSYMGKILKQVSWGSLCGDRMAETGYHVRGPGRVILTAVFLIQECFFTHRVPEKLCANSSYKLDQLGAASFSHLACFPLAAMLNT